MKLRSFIPGYKSQRNYPTILKGTIHRISCSNFVVMDGFRAK